jgi:adenylate cyclase
MAIVTWPKRRGIRDAACLRCVFDFAAELEKKSVEWNVHFGQLPQFRAVLHCGWVVTAEIGMERHKIAYFGDVMNTTGRLEALAKNFDEQVLVSAELFNSLVNPPGHLTSKNLGRHELRGRSEPLEVFAIRHIASRESEAVDSKNLQRQ